MNCWWMSSSIPLHVLTLLGIDGFERIEKRLVRARGHDTPLNAELVHGAGEAETFHDHADRSDHTRLVDVYLVCRDGDVIAARRGDVLHDDQ